MPDIQKKAMTMAVMGFDLMEEYDPYGLRDSIEPGKTMTDFRDEYIMTTVFDVAVSGVEPVDKAIAFWSEILKEGNLEESVTDHIKEFIAFCEEFRAILTESNEGE